MWPYNALSKITTPWRLRFGRIIRGLSSLRLGRQLGVVITEKSVRLCLVKQVLFQRRVVDTARYPLDPQNTATWPRRVDAAITAVRGYLGDRNIRRVAVNVSLVGEDIAFRRMYLPRMSKKELASAILWEGQKLFPFDFDECLVYHDTAEIRTQGEYEQIGVNMVAVKREIVEDLYVRMASAGLAIGHVDFLPAVVAKAIAASGAAHDVAQRLVLVLDDDQSLAIFVHNDRLEFFQQFVTNPIPDEVGRMMNAAAMASELTTFLDLFNGQQFGNGVDEIILAGTYADDPDTAGAFADNTGLPCRRLSETEGLPSPLRSFDGAGAEAMLDAIATGLADIGQHPLIPDTARRKIEHKKTTLRLAAAAMLILLIIGNFHVLSLLMNQRLHRDLESARKATQTYENSAAYHAYLSFLADITRRQTLQAQKQSRPSSHLNLLLKELSRTIPDNISLTTMEFSGRKTAPSLHLEGTVSLSGFSPEIVLAQYVETLGKSPFFDSITVERHAKKQKNDRFDLSFVLKMGARI